MRQAWHPGVIYQETELALLSDWMLVRCGGARGVAFVREWAVASWGQTSCEAWASICYGFLYQADGNVRDRGTVGLVEVVSDTSWVRGWRWNKQLAINLKVGIIFRYWNMGSEGVRRRRLLEALEGELLGPTRAKNHCDCKKWLGWLQCLTGMGMVESYLSPGVCLPSSHWKVNRFPRWKE